MNSETETLNYKYAPGLATYGIDGKDGSTGDSGTSFYFSSYVIDVNSGKGDNDFNTVITRIKDNLLLSKKIEYLRTPNVRKYIDGDIIIDTAGNLNRIKFNADNIPYFQYITTLNNFSGDSFFRHSTNSNRVYLDPSLYISNGFDVFSGENSSDVSTSSDALVRIIQSNKNSNDIYDIFSIIVKDNNNNVNYLNITYDQNISSFVFSSNAYISFDASKGIYVNTDDTDNEISSDYYKIRPYSDPIGLLHLVYRDSSVYMTSRTSGNISGVEYVFFITIPLSENINIDVKPDCIVLDTYSLTNNNKINNEYMITPVYSDWKIYNSSYLYIFSISDNDISRTKCISLTKGLSIFKKILKFSEDDTFGWELYNKWKDGIL